MEEVTKNKTLKREAVSDKVKTEAKKTSFEELDEEVKIALRSVSEKKALNTIVLDLRGLTSFTEFFVVTSGTNQRQVQAIADEVSDQLKKESKFRPNRIEGYESAEWVLLDYGDFIVHIFNEKSRDFYDLERLWRDAQKVDIPAEL